MQYEQHTRSGRAEFGSQKAPGREVDSESGFSRFSGGRRVFENPPPPSCSSRGKETLINSARFIVLVLESLGTESRSRTRMRTTMTTTRRTNWARLRIVAPFALLVPRSLSLAPRFSGVAAALDRGNRFNGFRHVQPSLHKKTAKAVQRFLSSFCTPVKRGVNERSILPVAT
jgi:hypothetical protein